MRTDNETVSDEVKAAIERVLRERMAQFGFKSAAIRAGYDHDGDPVLFVDASYDRVERPIDPVAIFGLVTEVRDLLEEIGERRFPHIQHDFHDDQEIEQPKRRGKRA